MKKVFTPLMVLTIAIIGVSTAFVLAPQSQVRVHASSDATTLNLGVNDSVTVPLANLIITNITHEYPVAEDCGNPYCIVLHIPTADILYFEFSNGTDIYEVSFYVTEKTKPINVKYLEYWYFDEKGLLNLDDTNNGWVITQNVSSPYADLYTHVTIYTANSTCTITAGEFVPTEFTVLFKDIDGNLLAEVETIGRYIPAELIPDAPQIDKRPFLRWTNVQGFAVNEIITSNVTFLPLYSYDPNFKVEDPKDNTEPKDETKNDIQDFFDNLFTDESTTIALGSIGGLFLLGLLILVIKGAAK